MSKSAPSVAQQILASADPEITPDELRLLASEYQRVVQERDHWKNQHDDVLADRERLRAAVETEESLP